MSAQLPKHCQTDYLITQCTEKSLNKISKAINDTFTALVHGCGVKNIFHEFLPIYLWWPNQVGGFYTFKSRISYKIYSEPRKHAF